MAQGEGDTRVDSRQGETSVHERSNSAIRTTDRSFTKTGLVIAPTRSAPWRAEPGTAAYLPALSVARANNWTQFADALRRWRGTGHNFVYADREGNIGWHATGLTPIRKAWNGLLPVPGDSGEFEWSGFVPAGEMPRTFNPSTHYIATANQNTIPANFPYSVSFRHTEPFRFQRLVGNLRGPLIQVHGRRLRADSARYHLHSRTALSIHLAQVAGASEQAKSLLEWDARLKMDSVQASLFEVWMSKLMDTVVGKELSPISSWAVLLEKLESEPDEQRSPPPGNRPFRSSPDGSARIALNGPGDVCTQSSCGIRSIPRNFTSSPSHVPATSSRSTKHAAQTSNRSMARRSGGDRPRGLGPLHGDEHAGRSRRPGKSALCGPTFRLG